MSYSSFLGKSLTFKSEYKWGTRGTETWRTTVNDTNPLCWRSHWVSSEKPNLSWAEKGKTGPIRWRANSPDRERWCDGEQRAQIHESFVLLKQEMLCEDQLSDLICLNEESQLRVLIMLLIAENVFHSVFLLFLKHVRTVWSTYPKHCSKPMQTPDSVKRTWALENCYTNKKWLLFLLLCKAWINYTAKVLFFLSISVFLSSTNI